MAPPGSNSTARPSAVAMSSCVPVLNAPASIYGGAALSGFATDEHYGPDPYA
jgi:hypothetical protein